MIADLKIENEVGLEMIWKPTLRNILHQFLNK